MAAAADAAAVGAVVGGLIGAVTCRADEKTVIRDSQGRVKATVTTDRYGKKTIRDSLGRIQGTETTDRYGKTTYRDCLRQLGFASGDICLDRISGCVRRSGLRGRLARKCGIIEEKEVVV